MMGCEYCDDSMKDIIGFENSRGITHHVYIHSGKLRSTLTAPMFIDEYSWSDPINFCPMCGRKLERGA